MYAGRVDPSKVRTRPGYLNAILIQSRGRTGRTCTHCRDNPNRGPFIDCRRVPGYFDGACGNCKWRDHAARCSARRPDEESDDEVPAIEGPGGQGGQEDREVQEVQEIEYVVISSDEE